MPSHHAGCYAAAFDSPGGVLATCGGDKLVRLWDPLTMTQTGTLRVRNLEAIHSTFYMKD